MSCSSATACTAVGNYLNDSSGDGGTLAERWNGKTWAVQSTPNPTGPRPTGSKDSYLQSVSCSSATACTAVGYYGTTISYDPEADVTLAERWNGKSWAVQPTPKSPSGASNINLYGVSCSSAIACTAVGWYYNSSYDVFPVVEGWNGKKWAVQSTPTLRAPIAPTCTGCPAQALSCAPPSAGTPTFTRQ